MKHALFLCSILLSAALGAVASAAAPAGFTESVFATNPDLSNATGMAWAPDGSNRLFVIRKNGQVRVIENGSSDPALFATVSPIYTNSECGLIGICFDPDFLNNRFVYFFVTVSASEQRIIRYTDNDGIGTNPAVIVQRLPTTGQNHDGGALGIGPDGHLYWAIGDLGNGTGVDSDLTSLAAKVGRANRFTGQPVADNPFNDGVGPNNEYIWARGFRNPFTMTFQQGADALWLNVVGTSYEQVFVVGRGAHGGYNDYENNQPAGFLQPTIVYRTNGADTRNIVAAGAVRTSGVTTFTTTSSHGFRAGARITITGVADSSFNGAFFVSDVPGPTVFTVPQQGADGTSGGGTATTYSVGGSLTGGYFYDSTLFPSEYHGNFFFGDYNSGQITRAVLDASNKVTSVDSFITGSSQQVDISTGPDGALYYVGVASGTVRRLAPSSSQQNIIIHSTALRVQEQGRALFTVRLAQQPASPVTVSVAKLPGGDADLVAQSSSLRFTPTNWNQLQSVTVHAAADVDSTNGRATFRVSAAGIGEYDVLATEIDAIEQTVPITELLYRKGDQVPGEPEGTVFTKFGLPSLDGEGVGFVSTIKSGKVSQQAIVGGTPAVVIVRQYDAAPGTDGRFASFRDPVFEGGRLAFIGGLKAGTGGVSLRNNDGIWSSASGSLKLIAREGNEAPGTGGGLFQTFVSLALPETGGAVFVAWLKGGSGDVGNTVTSRNDVGLWREIDGAPVLILREGEELVLGPTPGSKVKSFQTLRFVTGSEDQRRSHMNDGTLLVLVDFEDGTQAIVEAPGNGSALVAKAFTGEIITTPPGATLGKLGLPAGRHTGEAFAGMLTQGAGVTSTNDAAIFTSQGLDGISAKVREDDDAPDTGGGKFASFGVPALGGTSPTLTFFATLKKGTGTPAVKSSSDTGIWTNAGGTLRLLAREGGSAPGTGGTFAKLLSFAAAPDAVTLKALAFTATLRPGKGVTARNNVGLWAQDHNGTVWLLRRTGESVTLPENRSVRVTSLHALRTSVQTAGQGRTVDDSGQIVYRATLRKAGQAIFRVRMP